MTHWCFRPGPGHREKSASPVTSLSGGKIKKVYVSVGEEVKKGQTVVLIENAELDGERGRAGEKLRLGRETVANLEKKVRSSEELLSLGLVSESDVISLKQELNARRRNSGTWKPHPNGS